jgi:nicotinamidase-related amidase
MDNPGHKSKAALLLVDVINHFEFPDGERVLRNALPIAPRLAKLKRRAKRAGIPVIYVNDNFGQWRSDAARLVEYCIRDEARSKPFVEQIRPEPDDYLVLKPMHSAFFQTPIEVLLRYLGASSLILAGLATNSCIVCTAHDANMRDFELFVPSDCCAARTRQEHEEAIRHIGGIRSARVMASPSLRLNEIGKGGVRAAKKNG